MEERLINLYLSRILSGYFFIFHNRSRFKVKYPDIHVKYESEIIADREYEDLKYEGWYTRESILYKMIEMGVWSPSGDSLIKQLEKQIDDYKVGLYKDHINPKKAKEYRKKLTNTRKQLAKLQIKRYAYDPITIEGYCEGIKNQYLLTHSVYDESGQLYFVNNFSSSRFQIISSEISEQNIDIADFKKIARSDIWRNYWYANQDKVFDRPVIEWTDEQKTLINLTRMYDNARESLESPAEYVYEDDDMFDGWAISQRREHEREKDRKRTESSISSKHAKAQEVFIMAESKEEAKSIYGINDVESMGIIKERNNYIVRNTEVDASKLPDAKRDTTIKGNQTRMNRNNNGHT